MRPGQDLSTGAYNVPSDDHQAAQYRPPVHEDDDDDDDILKNLGS